MKNTTLRCYQGQILHHFGIGEICLFKILFVQIKQVSEQHLPSWRRNFLLSVAPSSGTKQLLLMMAPTVLVLAVSSTVSPCSIIFAL